MGFNSNVATVNWRKANLILGRFSGCKVDSNDEKHLSFCSLRICFLELCNSLLDCCTWVWACWGQFAWFWTWWICPWQPWSIWLQKSMVQLTLNHLEHSLAEGLDKRIFVGLQKDHWSLVITEHRWTPRSQNDSHADGIHVWTLVWIVGGSKAPRSRKVGLAHDVFVRVMVEVSSRSGYQGSKEMRQAELLQECASLINTYSLWKKQANKYNCNIGSKTRRVIVYLSVTTYLLIVMQHIVLMLDLFGLTAH